MAETNEKMPPCAVCKGAYEEHGPGKTQHAYTQDAGNLKTHEQVLKEQQRGITPQPTAIRLPGAQTSEAVAVGRLVEVLLEKGIMSAPEALYVAGMGSKPQLVTPHLQRYADPAQQALPGV